jgi:hypothetical protein
MITLLETDTLFDDSPDAGDPECLCSRCLKQIPEKDSPIIRMWPDGENKEYRYCRKCMEASGIHFAPDDDPLDE